MSPYSAKIINTQVYTEFFTHTHTHTVASTPSIYLSIYRGKNKKIINTEAFFQVSHSFGLVWAKGQRGNGTCPLISTSSSKPLTPSCQPPQQFPSQLSWIITSMFWAPSFIPAFPPAGLLLLLCFSSSCNCCCCCHVM